MNSPDRNTRQFNKMDDVLLGKVEPLFRDMLYELTPTTAGLTIIGAGIDPKS